MQNNQLRTSRTDYDSTTNPNIYPFVAIRGIRGLCGMGTYRNRILERHDLDKKLQNSTNPIIYQFVAIRGIRGRCGTEAVVGVESHHWDQP